MKLRDFKVLTFDCYGTLIDWETGILEALRPLTSRFAAPLSSDRILETYARHEAAQEAQNPALLYSKLLSVVHQNIADEWGIRTTSDENRRFGESVKNWPPFADTTEALNYLKKFYKLVILSNVDRESFRHSNQRLGVEFDQIYTAEDIGSYKPNLRNFEYLISHLVEHGFKKTDILHVAESLFHDHAPANQLGLASAWIHRRHGRQGSGATTLPKIMPAYNFRFNSLAEMAAVHARELGSNSPADSARH